MIIDTTGRWNSGPARWATAAWNRGRDRRPTSGEVLEPGETGETEAWATEIIDQLASYSPENPAGVHRRSHGTYYRTGDLASRDEDGYFFFEGRADDIIISAGYRIGPFEVEDALVSHEAVAEAAAVASPHEARGSIVKAFVVPSDDEGSDDLVDELQSFMKAQTAPYKYPREIEFVAELPKTSSGKIRRIELRSREQD